MAFPEAVIHCFTDPFHGLAVGLDMETLQGIRARANYGAV